VSVTTSNLELDEYSLFSSGSKPVLQASDIREHVAKLASICQYVSLLLLCNSLWLRNSCV